MRPTSRGRDAGARRACARAPRPRRCVAAAPADARRGGIERAAEAADARAQRRAALARASSASSTRTTAPSAATKPAAAAVERARRLAAVAARAAPARRSDRAARGGAAASRRPRRPARDRRDPRPTSAAPRPTAISAPASRWTIVRFGPCACAAIATCAAGGVGDALGEEERRRRLGPCSRTVAQQPLGELRPRRTRWTARPRCVAPSARREPASAERHARRRHAELRRRAHAPARGRRHPGRQVDARGEHARAAPTAAGGSRRSGRPPSVRHDARPQRVRRAVAPRARGPPTTPRPVTTTGGGRRRSWPFQRPRTRAALAPPKPRLVETAARSSGIGAARRAPDRPRARDRRRRRRAVGWTSRSSRPSTVATASMAPGGAEQMAEHALGRFDRNGARARSPKTRASAAALGGVVERRARCRAR